VIVERPRTVTSIAHRVARATTNPLPIARIRLTAACISRIWICTSLVRGQCLHLRYSHIQVFIEAGVVQGVDLNVRIPKNASRCSIDTPRYTHSAPTHDVQPVRTDHGPVIQIPSVMTSGTVVAARERLRARKYQKPFLGVCNDGQPSRLPGG
jgi:hypothetical protein